MSKPVVLRNRSFAAAWVGQFLSQGATRMFQVGMVWWLVGLAGGENPGRQSGLVLMCATIPAVALVPVVSRIIARNDRRRTLAVSTAVAGVLAAGGAALTSAWPPHLGVVCALALFLSCCQAVFDPCLSTAIPELVADGDVESATGFQLATQSIAGLAGGFLGPLVVEACEASGLMFSCATAYLTAAVLIAVHRFPVYPAQRPAPHGASRPHSRGVLRRLPAARRILLCFTAANFFSTAVFVLMPLFVRGVLHMGGAAVSAFEAALGAGTIAGAALGSRLPLRLRTVGGGGLALAGVGLAAPGLLPRPGVAGLGLVLAGLCIGAIGVRFVSCFQRQVPPPDKPAFFAIMQALIGATLPLSAIVFGALGDAVAVRVLLLAQGAGLIPVAWAARRAATGLDDEKERK